MQLLFSTKKRLSDLEILFWIKKPEQTKPNFSKPKFGNDEKIQPGKDFVYKDINGKDVEFRWDKKGHKYDDGTEVPPHINGPHDMHYIYDDKKK